MGFVKLNEVTLVETAAETANVLIEENNEIKRVPKSEVGGGGNAGLLIVDLDKHTDRTCEDKAIGDALKEAIRAGQAFCIFMQDKYYYPTFCEGESTTTADNVWVYKLVVTSGSTVFYFDLTEEF